MYVGVATTRVLQRYLLVLEANDGVYKGRTVRATMSSLM